METFIDSVTNGLAYAFQPTSLILVILGVAFGIVLGALPGVTGVTGMAVVLPFTFYMKPEDGIVLMVSILVGSQFGNSIPAILIRTPGTPSAVLIVEEGYKFHLRGESGRALGLSLISSTIGQLVSILGFIAFVIPLSKVAVRFLFPELFAIMVLALGAAASLTGRSPVKGLIAACFGIILATVGPDPVTSQPRFNFGFLELQVGLDIIPVLLGLLAFSEVFRTSRQMIPWEKIVGKFSFAMPSWADLRLSALPMTIGILLGFWMGILPGAGPTAGTFVSYSQARLWAKHREQFGKGSVEGLVAADSANNAAVGGDLVPTLGLGIPGAAGMVIILGALMIQGVQPGPLLLKTRPELLYATFGGLVTATLFMFLEGLLTIRLASYITMISRPVVTIATLALVVIGVFAINWSIFDVGVAVVMGFVGYLMNRYGYPIAPAVLGFILGKLAEENLRRGLIMTGGYLEFVSRPLTAGILIAAALTTLLPLLLERWRKEAVAEVEVASEDSRTA